MRTFRLAVLCLAAIVGTTIFARSARAYDTIPIVAIGRVETSPGTPATACTVSVWTASTWTWVGSCGSDGRFAGGPSYIPSYWGTVGLRIDVPGAPTRYIWSVITLTTDGTIGLNERVVDAGTIFVALGPPGAVTGHLYLASSSDYDGAVVGIPELGLFVQPNVAGVYLIPSVAAGTHTVTLYVPGKPSATSTIAVTSGTLRTGVNFGSPPPY